MKSRPVVIILAGAVVLLAMAGLFLLLRAPAAPAPAPRTAEAPPAAAPPPPAPKTRAPVAPARPARPRPKPAPATPPAPPPAPTTGTLHITSDVPDTSVFIDHRYLGSAPVTATGLRPGPHQLTLSPTGYDAVIRTIEVELGAHDLSVSFKQPELDAAIQVVHKHAMGSCRGTLRATGDALTYETTDTKDAFSVPLSALETFEVDYLDKNLKVKVRGGRTYNFTDPDGNADHLYLFWQKVDPVRKRLAGGGGPTAATGPS